jgi:hypothetical protein
MTSQELFAEINVLFEQLQNETTKKSKASKLRARTKSVQLSKMLKEFRALSRKESKQ